MDENYIMCLVIRCFFFAALASCTKLTSVSNRIFFGSGFIIVKIALKNIQKSSQDVS